MVLYFGLKHWNKKLSLADCLDIPEDLRPFVSDYKINVFEIAYLTDEQVKMFKSDFKLIADYFVQYRKTGSYKSMPDNIKHVWETLNLMSVLTNDNRFEKMYDSLNEKEAVNMCKVIDDYINAGMEKGMERGILSSIKNLISNLGLSEEQAINAVGVPEEEKSKYLKMLAR